MNIRGERRCKDCGTTWSYADTGSVECPNCGSRLSVGVDDRALQTDKPTEYDLTAARNATDDQRLQAVATIAKDESRAYVRARGFISDGDLRPLSETYVAAQELAYAAATIERSHSVSENDPEGFYLYSLLRGADAGERPPANEVPESMHHARGLAAAAAIRDYRTDAVDWLDERTDHEGERGDVRRALETLGDHGKRVEALDGEVAPETADELVVTAREIGTALRKADSESLASARERLARLMTE